MKTTSFKRLSALSLAFVLTGMMQPALRAQLVQWTFQDFTGNICGFNSYDPLVTLAYDPTQDDTGNGGGSCHVTTDYSQSGVFQFTASDVPCCMCLVEALLELTNYNTVDFDVKWDDSSTVPLSFFNTNHDYNPGISIEINTAEGIHQPISTVIIPDAASNGWVHISAAINQLAAPNTSFVALVFEKAFPGYEPSNAVASGPTNTAAFWLDNVRLVGPTIRPVLSPTCQGSNFTVCFPVIQGATYSVLKSTDFLNWTSLVTNYPAGGAATNMTLCFTDTNASPGQAYYRVSSP